MVYYVYVDSRMVATVFDRTLALAFGKLLTKRHARKVRVTDADGEEIYYCE